MTNPQHSHTQIFIRTHRRQVVFQQGTSNKLTKLVAKNIANFLIIFIYICFLHYCQSHWRYVFACLLFRKKNRKKCIFLYFPFIRSLLSSKKYETWNKLYHPAFFFFIQILASARQYANENRLINDSLIFSRHFSLRSALNWCSSKRIRRIKSLYQFLLPRYFSPS